MNAPASEENSDVKMKHSIGTLKSDKTSVLGAAEPAPGLDTKHSTNTLEPSWQTAPDDSNWSSWQVSELLLDSGEDGASPIGYTLRIDASLNPDGAGAALVEGALRRHGLELDWANQREGALALVDAVATSAGAQFRSVESVLNDMLAEATGGAVHRLEMLDSSSLLDWQARMLDGISGTMFGIMDGGMRRLHAGASEEGGAHSSSPGGPAFNLLGLLRAPTTAAP